MKQFNMYNCYSVSRFLLGAGLLSLAIFAKSIAILLLLLVLSVVLICLLDGHALTAIRLLRLLRWFVVPIILLHALFTPGQLLWPELFIAISREGLIQGLKLSLHLSVIFFVAMLMFHLLKRAEWLRYLLSIPYIGERMAIYVWMMSCMKMSNSRLLSDLRCQFRLRKDMKRAPLLLISAFRRTLLDASEHACLLWLRWPEHRRGLNPISVQAERSSVHYHVVSLLLLTVSFSAFLWPWM